MKKGFLATGPLRIGKRGGIDMLLENGILPEFRLK